MFVGRVHKIKNPIEATYAYRFRVLCPTSGSGSLALTYPTKSMAMIAQQTLLRADNTYYVGNTKLFEAMWEAFELVEEHVKAHGQSAGQ